MAYLIQDWHNLQMTIAIVVFSMSLLWFFIPESPRWLIAKGRYEEAKKIITKGAKVNGKTIPQEMMEIQKVEQDSDVPELGFASLFDDKYVTKNTLIMCVNWLVTTMCYYGLSMNSVNLSSSIYLNFVLTASIEIPSYIFCVLVMDGWGRKPILVFCQFLAGTTCIAAAFPEEDWLVLTLTLLGLSIKKYCNLFNSLFCTFTL